MTKKGILLINLGTPDNCEPRSVYRYLTEFLNDPRVVDLPSILRWILVNIIIVPLRFKKSAKAYQKIWTAQGSPLLFNSQQIAQALAQELGKTYQVELAMRYGNPSIATALEKLKDCASLNIIPLFPQYSSAATGSAVAKAFEWIGKQWNIPEITVMKDFYNNPDFIAAYADVIQKNINNKKIDSKQLGFRLGEDNNVENSSGKRIDKILFSFHGLPERHIHKSACQAKCDSVNACRPINEDNQFCYRAQCYATSRLLARALNLTSDQYTVCFQSRLGRTPWIKPYTDLVLSELIHQGIKNIAIVCPSFVADCLETLEEINIRAREQWQALGGGEFVFVPCINAHPAFIKGLAVPNIIPT